eukprot:scaffold1778_cov101-Cylindrotheca_fusiformis.AAC.1
MATSHCSLPSPPVQIFICIIYYVSKASAREAYASQVNWRAVEFKRFQAYNARIYPTHKCICNKVWNVESQHGIWK